MTSPWTPARKLQLSELWLAGTLLNDIAVTMETTKSNVSGMVGRLRLPRRAVGPPKRPRRRPPVSRATMTKTQLLTWFRQAAPGDRISYYCGDLARARHDIHARGAREVIELADAARVLGMPQTYEVYVNPNASMARVRGQGLAHLAQRRIEAGSYEYWITKASEVVLT